MILESSSPSPLCVSWLPELLGRSHASSALPPASLDHALRWLTEALSLPSPPPFLAFGELDDDGALRSSPDLAFIRSSLGHAADTVSGPLRLVVDGRVSSLGDPSLADRLREQVPAGCRVVGVRSLADALVSVLNLPALAREGLLLPEENETGWVVERLFRIALEDASVPIGWTAVSALAVGLLSHRLHDRALRWKAAFVRDVARRHTGEGVLLRWPDDEALAALPFETRLRVMAHAVQSAADGSLERVGDYVASAQDELPPAGRPLGPAEARLVGAMGRALAAVGDYERASETLQQALEAWQRLDPSQSSYPLCELLRVRGILGQAEAVQALSPSVAPFLAPGAADRVSAAFVRLAWGRALVQAQKPDAAHEALSPEDAFAGAPPHAQTARLRWLAHALRQQGLYEEASKAMDALATHGDTDQLYLARLDEALLANRPDDAASAHALGALDAPEGGDEAQRLLQRLAPWQAPADALRERTTLERFAREYRY